MIIKAVAAIALLLGFMLAPVALQAASPITSFDVCQQGVVTNSSICNAAQGTDSLFGPNGVWNKILNAITYVIGGIAILMIVIGALRYAISAGDQGSVTSAKNTILYALIALIIAVMANALVNFVLTNI